jgi:phenylalanyl-tRNA synthetase beta chain
MKILMSWLQEFADFGDDAHHIADSLTSLGLAVESITPVGGRVEGVVVARVLRVERHPEAEKVRRVWVDAGDGVERHVWCGASNMSAGDLVPLAQLDTTMPDGRTITRRGILGIDSEGMLCSASELGLAADASGILLLPSDAPLGRNVFDALGVAPDVLFDLDVTRNRPDCNGYLGVARDLAAKLELPLRAQPVDPPASGDDMTIPVSVESPERCPRFTVTVLSGITVGPSPAWIARRLANAGMRSINNVVDVSNLVNLEMNQPNHAYDVTAVQDGFVVRTARDGESMTTLDGVDRELCADDLLICSANRVPVGLAGIMGGLNSEVTAATTAIALEIAYFEPGGISRSVSRLALRTEASLRFERGVDPHNIESVVRRFAALLRETCPNLVVHRGAADKQSPQVPPVRRPVDLRLQQVQRVLGVSVTAQQVAALLDPIGFAVEPSSNDAVVVRVPSWRGDCVEEIDLVEEIARHVGYDALGKSVPTSPMHGKLSMRQQRRRLLREVLLGLGASEAMPNPFLAAGELSQTGADESCALRLANPLVAEESVLRTSLRPGLLKTVAYNQSHRITDISLFEVGHVYPQGSDLLPDEYESVCIMVVGHDASTAVDMWSQIADALDVGAQVDTTHPPSGFHPTRSASLRRGKTLLGAVGEIHPEVLAAYGIEGRVACVELNADMICAENPKIVVAKSISRYPSSDFDLALVVGHEIRADLITRALRQGGGALLVSVELFDVYRGAGLPAGTRSLAYRLRVQADDRTLTDVEVAGVRKACIAAAEKAGASLR